MMDGNEHDLGGFPVENKHRRAESMVGACCRCPALTEELRQNQYLADVAQENADERLARGEAALDPNTPENRERWNTAQVNNHESLFSFSDNLTTLTFIVACDLSEAQRERQVPFLYKERISPLTPLKL